MDWTVLSLLLLLSVTGCFTAKIVMMPMFGRSHFIVMEKLGQELKNRGHEVSILVGDEASYAIGKPHVKTFEFPEKLKKAREQHTQELTDGQTKTTKLLANLFKQQQNYCDLFLSDNVMINEVKSADVLIGDSLYPCSFLVADMLGIPHVVVAMSGISSSPTLVLFGLYSNPSYVPQLNSFRPRDMGLLDRIINLGVYLINNYLIVQGYYYPTYGELKTKYKIKPEKSIRETLATVDMVLLTMNLVTDHAQPLPPYFREVGNFMPSPPKPLPAELEDFFERSGDNGVIYVSFGSIVDRMSNNVIEILNKALSKVPYKVLWRVNVDKFKGQIASNIKVVNWVPQNDVLGHSKTRLFFTHAGANGIAEASYHGIPMLCLPFFGDQHDNAQTLKDAGMAEVVSLDTITTEQLTRLLKQLIQDKRYKERMSHASRVLKSSPRSPVQQAAEVIEYVHAVGGDLMHLKPRGLDLPFYQLYMLDVMLVLGLVVTAVLSISFMSVRLLINICCAPSKKTKTS